NVFREVKAAPSRRSQIIKHFVDRLGQSVGLPLGYETWDEAKPRLLPLLKPRNYIDSEGATRHSLVTDWLGDVIICYALKTKDIFRFVTTIDAERWELDSEAIHQVAIENLAKLPWPSRLEGARQRDRGRLIIVETRDGMAS